MCNVLPAGILLPKHVPSFTAVLYGRVAPGFPLDQLFETARTVMGRRGKVFGDGRAAALPEPLRPDPARARARLPAPATAGATPGRSRRPPGWTGARPPGRAPPGPLAYVLGATHLPCGAVRPRGGRDRVSAIADHPPQIRSRGGPRQRGKRLDRGGRKGIAGRKSRGTFGSDGRRDGVFRIPLVGRAPGRDLSGLLGRPGTVRGRGSESAPSGRLVLSSVPGKHVNRREGRRVGSGRVGARRHTLTGFRSLSDTAWCTRRGDLRSNCRSAHGRRHRGVPSGFHRGGSLIPCSRRGRRSVCRGGPS